MRASLDAPEGVDARFVHELVTATQDVFSTMVFMDIDPCHRPAAPAVRGRTTVVGSVAFTGCTSGLVVFSSTIETARKLTGSMLGLEPESVGEELPDAMGELTNMIAGSFRTRMAAHIEEPWAISVPTVTVGTDFYTKYVGDAQRVLCPFQIPGDEILVELIVTSKPS
jgi:chemotaxis protein CheX